MAHKDKDFYDGEYPEDEYSEDYDGDDFYDEDFADAILDACDNDLSPKERAQHTRKAIGLGILKSLNDIEKDDLQYLLNIAWDYCLSVKTVMSFASDRLADIYCVGDLYLTPLFKDTDLKGKYILVKMQEWEKISNETQDNFKFSEKRILRRVFHMPIRYASTIEKHLYTRDELANAPIKQN